MNDDVNNDVWFYIFSFIDNNIDCKFLIDVCMVNKKFNCIINEKIKPIYMEFSRICFRLTKGLKWAASFYELENLSNLQEFDMSHSEIEIIPKEINLFISLQSLDLSCNEIKIIPKEIGKLTNLQKLNLSCNNIKIVPKKIRKLINLKILDLSFNNIQIIPKEIKQLTNLTDLYLYNNQNDIEKLTNPLNIF
jgi:Leucine-rich repeat (LRR) protein